jgi:hypothetical protein
MTAAEDLADAITAKHGPKVAESVAAALDDLGLMVVSKPDYGKKAARDTARMIDDEKFAETRRALRHQASARVQRATLDGAGRRGLPWTGPELEIAARDDLTPEQVAEMTGRTLYGVNEARKRLRRDPRAIALAGVRVPRE